MEEGKNVSPTRVGHEKPLRQPVRKELQ